MTLLPEPDSPTTAATSPALHVEVERRARHATWPAAHGEADVEVADLEQRLPSRVAHRLALTSSAVAQTVAEEVERQHRP